MSKGKFSRRGYALLQVDFLLLMESATFVTFFCSQSCTFPHQSICGWIENTWGMHWWSETWQSYCGAPMVTVNFAKKYLQAVYMSLSSLSGFQKEE